MFYAWYCLLTHPAQMDRARRHLERHGYHVCHPLYVVQKFLRGAWQDVAVPLFPGYLLVELTDEDDWGQLNHIDGVRQVLRGTAGQPMSLPPSFMSELLRRLEHGPIRDLQQSMERLIAVGDQVKIAQGTLAGLSGTCVWTDNSRLKVLLSFLGAVREVQVEYKLVDLVSPEVVAAASLRSSA